MNANDSAFPIGIVEIDDLMGQGRQEGMVAVQHCQRPGLTIREHMATQAMQGLLSSMPDAENAEREERPIESLGIASKRIAIASVAYADALISELNKPVVQQCTCGEPHISDRIQHCYDGKPCFVKT